MDELVTVVTATWSRPKTVVEHAVTSVNRQGYSTLEHIVVIDGYHSETLKSLWDAGYGTTGMRRVVSLGRNWTSVAGDGGTGVAPRVVGAYLAEGDIISYLDDDNDWEPDHVQNVVDVFRSDPSYDVVLTGMCRGGPGFPAPVIGQVDTSGLAHKPHALVKANWTMGEGNCEDGRLAERWAQAGLHVGINPLPTVAYNGPNQGRPMA
jgi:hypothetical protein